jgi:hypothetical protein
MAEVEYESFCDLGDLSGIPDEHTKEEGECELRIVTLELRPGKKDPTSKFIYAQFEVPGDDLAKIIQHVFMLPGPKDTPKQKMSRERAIKKFYEAFKIPLAGRVEFKDYIGNTGWAMLVEEDNEKYGMQNRIKSFV